MTKRILFVVNQLKFFNSHRLPVAKAAQEAGYDVFVAGPEDIAKQQLIQLGMTFVPIDLKRRSTNPFGELTSLFEIVRLFRSVRPTIVHLITIKPILYGCLAGYLFPHMSIIAAVSGLGPAFIGTGGSRLLSPVIKTLYRIAFRRHRIAVIFQNMDDKKILCDITGLPESKSTLIRGSGVDLKLYTEEKLPERPIRVLMASRLLHDKGVGEFVEAARQLVCEGVDAEFIVAGEPDEGSPGTVTPADILRWKKQEAVEFIGYRSDMSTLISSCSLVVLPSYYGEGLPKILIEAAACGRAVITTDHPGCRDAITPGVTGLLVPPKDSMALADAVRKLCNDKKMLVTLGRNGRKLAEEAYSIEKNVDAHMTLYEECSR